MTPRDLLIGMWPWSLPDDTASHGADMVLKALDAAGYVIVPKEPTEEMVEAGGGALPLDEDFWQIARECYRTMISAYQ